MKEKPWCFISLEESKQILDFFNFENFGATKAHYKSESSKESSVVYSMITQPTTVSKNLPGSNFFDPFHAKCTISI